MEKTYIYYLSRTDDVPFYVGKTKNTINKRLNSHNYLKEKGLKINIIDEVNTSEWKFWEKYYISLFKSWGFNLENKNKGGSGPSGGYNLTKEHKDNISKANKSKPKPKEFGEKLSKDRKGKWVIPQHQIEAGIKARSKVTIQYDKQGNFIAEYPSAKYASQSIGICETNMIHHLSGKYKTCRGFIFKYKI